MRLGNLVKRLKKAHTLPPTDDRAARGQLGEDAAAKALKKAGFKILCRNWRHGHDEIDLVCRDGEVLVFVEVRTRDAASLTPGVHSLGPRKKAALKRVCKAYQRQLNHPSLHIRFDVIEVSLCQDGKIDLHHHQNIPLIG